MSINRILADLGKAVDSSSTGNFLNKEASGAEFNPVQWSDINSAPTILDSALASAIIDSAYVQARQTGVGSGGLDSATTIALVDSSYVGARASTGGSGFVKYQYTATASQTTFQDSDANGNVLSYDADYILVHYNGVLLPSADYTATDGSSVVLGTGADSGSIIGIAKWGAAAGSSSGGGGAGIYGDRAIISVYTGIDYFNITTPGNASSFGSFGTTPGAWEYGALSDAIYGVMGNLEYFSSTSRLEYITIATTGNGTDFGDLSTNRSATSGLGDGTYGLFCGGATSYYNQTGNNVNTIDYITVASPGNATDFGDLVYARFYTCAASDGTYGFIAGGLNATGNGSETNKIDVVTTATPGNATTFGNLDDYISRPAACSNETRMLISGGRDGSGNRKNVIQYITTASASNATDFGDLTEVRGECKATNNATRAVIAGGYGASASLNSIDYVTIATTGNASDFGDLTTTMGDGMDTGISGHAS